MKALTISQPHASRIANNEKFVENRRWHTDYRGPLAIHAGKGTQYLSRQQMKEQHLPTGVVVAIVDLQACFSIEEIRRRAQCKGAKRGGLPPWLTWEQLLEHEHTEGPYCLVLGDLRKLDNPIPAVGCLGIWEWDHEMTRGFAVPAGEETR